MQEKSIGEGDSPASEDFGYQRAVLAQVLAHHPSRLTYTELAREVCEDPDSFDQGDGIARAVRDLAASGLVRTEGTAVVPSRAALHFDRLGL